ncbi:hypothetical protein [Streptomyces sp. NPDC006879]|uniref:hypothetical protein n=1 Tax=Streptomyces sp. NPDC006879 TaxID=3364767 RepID=UPI0036C0E491
MSVDTVLRKRSFAILSWLLPLLPLLPTLAVLGLLMEDVNSGLLIAIAPPFVGIAVMRRILISRVILGGSELRVVNAIFTYHLTYDSISSVGVNSGGTLIVEGMYGERIHAGGFGGSVVDHFLGASARAAESVKAQVRKSRKKTQAEPVKKKISRSWLGDAFLVLALIFGIWAVVLEMSGS